MKGGEGEKCVERFGGDDSTVGDHSGAEGDEEPSDEAESS